MGQEIDRIHGFPPRGAARVEGMTVQNMQIKEKGINVHKKKLAGGARTG